MFASTLKNIKSKRDLDKNTKVGIGQESEIETLQNALQEAMLRERQLIQEKAQREDEMKQQRNATKQCIEVLIKEKKELMDNNNNNNNNNNNKRLSELEIEAKQNKKDLERVLQKLSQREHEHNQFNEEILKLKSSLKYKTNENNKYKNKIDEIEKNYRISTDKLQTMQEKIEKANQDSQKFINSQTLLEKITNQLKDTCEKNKIINQEKENLRDELIIKETCICKYKTELTEAKKYKLINFELRNKLEELRVKGKIEIDELINENEKYKIEINHIQNEIKENENNYKIEINEANNEINILNEKIINNEREIFEINNKFETKINSLNDLRNELEIEYKIKERKKNKLIKELREQLKKEIIKSQELKCKVLKLNDENLNAGANINHIINLNNISVLAKKLEIEVKSNFSLKEQIKYLHQSIQQLHIDLDNKKTVITNLTKRIDIGALPTINKNNKNNKNNNKNNKNYIQQLQLLMQETTLQNAMLRKDLKLMGSELNTKIQKIKSMQNKDEVNPNNC